MVCHALFNHARPYSHARSRRNGAGRRGRRPLPQTIENHWDFKAYLSKAHHIGFQRNFFDTRIRDAAHYAEKWKYICLNPVARGLVSTPREWPHSLAFDRETGAERPHR